MNPKLTATLLALVMTLTLTACGGAPNGADAVTSSTADSREAQPSTEPAFRETVPVDKETFTVSPNI